MTLPASISHAVQQSQEWLKALRDAGDLANETEALAELRAVLHQLRDRLTADEAADLGAQLPLLVRGIYFEGWRPSHKPDKIRSADEFLEGVSARLMPHQIAAEPAARDVFALLARACDRGEIADVIAQLPPSIKALWPEEARDFAARRHVS